MCRVFTAALAGLLLLALLFPQAALADPSGYAITLIPYSGVYCDIIEARVSVEEAGTYHICWKDALISKSVAQIYATGAGNYSAQFPIPEAARSTATVVHKVFLIKSDDNKLAEATLEVRPTVEIEPNKGPVGAAVGIKGYGFTTNEANIPVLFRGSQVRTASANALGSWTVSYTIPSLPSGTYKLEVGPDKVTEETWHIHFSVTPKITVTPVSGVVGQTVDVSGTGFARNEKGIRVIFDGEVVKDDVSADDNGVWSTKIVVPPRRGGTYDIDASGFITWARDVPDVPFKIETGVWVDPTSARVGEQITVTGSGFSLWEGGIKVTFDGRVMDTGAIAADKDGAWKASFALPTSVFGPHTVSAYGDITKAADVKTTTLNTLAAMEVSPVQGSPGNSVTLTGRGFPGNQALAVTFANLPVQEEVRSASDGTLSAIVTVPASPVGALTITAAGGGAQASTDFTVQAKVLPTPQPLSPESDRRFRSGEVAFRWGRIQTNSDTTYTLEITGPGGSQVISGLKVLTYQVPKQEALPRGEYQWRVKAVDEFGNESEWSAPMPFAVSPISTLVWVLIGASILTVLMAVAYREGKFKVTE